MYPDLFTIGPFTLHTYGLFVAAGFFVGMMTAVKLAKREGISSEQVMDMGFVIILSAIIGSRLMYVLINASEYIHAPLDILKIWEGGLVFSGGVIGVVLTMLWYVKRHGLSVGKIADLWAPGIAIGQAIGRIGCFMAGCCYGRPTDGKCGIVFTDPHSLARPLNVPLYPTQLYASASSLVIFLVLLLLYSKRKFEGQVFLWFLIIHSTARLAIERFRGDNRGIIMGTDMTVTQFVAILILIISVGILCVIKAKKKDKSQQGPS
ncbi:MAG: prolipoprotein diacylglyceryl transferase [Deltaproteobacteria bacterium]|nr:MAG: prolipoprotein diacylglyceryl transferase [Deltaproteobacteria bacterium]